MAGFEARSLCLVNSVPYGTGGRAVDFFHYATADAVATVIAAGYFNNARDKLAINDVIEALCVADGTGDRVSLIVTAAPATGNVTTAINTDASGA
ncbi:hypothetical protein OOJ09_12835 [Mesorhizobium qingshengii]|uniref:Uncharacterized protein n=1 Tax=Mesorhizobium qingshengii TaxID=1165689 RepID=A0ABT4QU21_9HYPH|nr:hypothetical protein [Mesorhizobium qingshengii]MCZ8545072.1 hypothetical protein [Mesorhizobium qingshengii]